MPVICAKIKLGIKITTVASCEAANKNGKRVFAVKTCGGISLPDEEERASDMLALCTSVYTPDPQPLPRDVVISGCASKQRLTGHYAPQRRGSRIKDAGGGA